MSHNMIERALAKLEHDRHRLDDGTVMNRRERRRRNREMAKAGVPELESVERQYLAAISKAELQGDNDRCQELVTQLKQHRKYYATHWGVYSDDLAEEASVDGSAQGS